MGNEGKKRVRKSPEERKKEIIAAASRLIGEKGYYGTSLKDIADAIGMSQPGLLHYIGNKERLLSLLVTDNYDQEGTPADFAKSGLPGSDPEGRIFQRGPSVARLFRESSEIRVGTLFPVHMEIAA